MANQLILDLALPPPTYLRDDFVVADGNREALAWIDRWPDWPAPVLSLNGPGGCGKTHLGWIWAARSGAVVMAGTDLEGKSVADLTDLAVASPRIVISKGFTGASGPATKIISPASLPAGITASRQVTAEGKSIALRRIGPW